MMTYEEFSNMICKEMGSRMEVSVRTVRRANDICYQYAEDKSRKAYCADDGHCQGGIYAGEKVSGRGRNFMRG